MSTERPFTSIDRDRLDEEAFAHSDLYLEWAEALAKAESKEADFQKYLNVIEADLIIAINTHPKKFKLTKTSIPIVKAAIIIQPEYLEAQDLLFKASAKVRMLKAAVRALEHRKTLLAKGIDLEISGYHSTPRPSGKSREYVGEAVKRSARQPLKKYDPLLDPEIHDANQT